MLELGLCLGLSSGLHIRKVVLTVRVRLGFGVGLRLGFGVGFGVGLVFGVGVGVRIGLKWRPGP